MNTKVSKNFIETALYARFEQVKHLWGSTPEYTLFGDFVEMLCEVSELTKPVSYYVDNFLINGEFVSREDYKGDWEDLCQNKGILSNDKYCCLNLGL